MRLAVLVSGTGSILDTFLSAGLPVGLVVADRPCPAIERASGAGVEAVMLQRSSYGESFDRDGYCSELAQLLLDHGIELVAMAGFGTILAKPMHDVFPNRIINTHPALLPAFKGWHAVEEALAAGVDETGCTIHVAGLEVDTGLILAQERVQVRSDDDVESLHERIKAVERPLYTRTLKHILEVGPGVLDGRATEAQEA